MATAPTPVRPNCDVPGCGMKADLTTDGSEVDAAKTHDGKPLGRKAVAKLNLDTRHAGWAFSDDAKVFAATSTDYKTR